jgi:hypothetical protein
MLYKNPAQQIDKRVIKRRKSIKAAKRKVR